MFFWKRSGRKWGCSPHREVISHLDKLSHCGANTVLLGRATANKTLCTDVLMLRTAPEKWNLNLKPVPCDWQLLWNRFNLLSNQLFLAKWLWSMFREINSIDLNSGNHKTPLKNGETTGHSMSALLMVYFYSRRVFKLIFVLQLTVDFLLVHWWKD